MTSQFEKMVIDNRMLRHLPIDHETKNYVRQVARSCMSICQPTPLPRPKLVCYSRSALKLLGIKLPADHKLLESHDKADMERYCSGNDILPSSTPFSNCYVGFQFGSFAGQLGDGAAHTIAEAIAPIPPSESPLVLDGFSSEAGLGGEQHDYAAASALQSTTIRGCEGTPLLPETMIGSAGQRSATVNFEETLRREAAAARSAEEKQREAQEAATKAQQNASLAIKNVSSHSRAQQKREEEERARLRKEPNPFLQTPHVRYELQLKGAGLTPFSRTADGRKVLRSSLREFLCSEAMFALNIPTSRCGTIVVSPETVDRDPLYTGRAIPENCSVITRIAPSMLRFGSLDICRPASLDEDGEENLDDDEDQDGAGGGDDEGEESGSGQKSQQEKARRKAQKQQMSSHVRQGPSAETGKEPVLALFQYVGTMFFPREWAQAESELRQKQKAQTQSLAASLSESSLNVRVLAAPLILRSIVRSTARLVAQWQCVGFIHGVLNTDNMSLLGLTIDYGPFEFMGFFDKEHVGNASDHTGRYRYENQPEMCAWNCCRLLESFQLMFGKESLPSSLNEETVRSWFFEIFKNEMRVLLRAKLFGVLPEEQQQQNEGEKKNKKRRSSSTEEDEGEGEENSTSSTSSSATSSASSSASTSRAPSLSSDATTAVTATTASGGALSQQASVAFAPSGMEVQNENGLSLSQNPNEYRAEWIKSIDEVNDKLFELMQETSSDFTQTFVILEKLQPQMVTALTHYVTAITSTEEHKKEALLKKMQTGTDEKIKEMSVEMGKICAPVMSRLELLQKRALALRPRTPIAVIQQVLAASNEELRSMFPNAPIKLVRDEFENMLENAKQYIEIVNKIKAMRSDFTLPDPHDPTNVIPVDGKLEKQNVEKWLKFLHFFEKHLRASWMRTLPDHYTISKLNQELETRLQTQALSNPRFVLRNWIAQTAIEAAERETKLCFDTGGKKEPDYSFVYTLLSRLEDPFLEVEDYMKKIYKLKEISKENFENFLEKEYAWDLYGEYSKFDKTPSKPHDFCVSCSS